MLHGSAETPRCIPWILTTLLLACSQEPAEAPAKPVPVVPPISRATTTPKISAAAVRDRTRPFLSPIPATVSSPDNPGTETPSTTESLSARIELGKSLFSDTRLSKDGTVACNTCHDLARYGIDVRESNGKRLATSPGPSGQPGRRNSPSVYNAALHASLFWDGRVSTLEEQAESHILDPAVMGKPEASEVASMLRSVPDDVVRFQAAFPGEKEAATLANAVKAIAAFERQLLTPARLDEFIRGKMTALSDQELKGLELFLDVGCLTCHTGPALGGVQFQKLGTVKPWPGLEDEGRSLVTHVEDDKFVFKVAALRNVAQTAPYLHNGSIDSLETVVRKMIEYQAARGHATDEEVAALVAFLTALTGTTPS